MLLSRRTSSSACNRLKCSCARRLSTSNNSNKESSGKNNDLKFTVDQMKSFSIGSLGGMLGSLAGMGGGFVMIPMMTAARGLRLSQHQAHGTSLFAVGSTGIFGALAYGIKGGDTPLANSNKDTNTLEQQGLVDLEIAIALTATAMITSRFGANASSRLSEQSLKKVLGAFMLLVAPLVPGKKYLDGWSKDTKKDTTKNQQKDSGVAQHSSNLKRLLPASFIGIFSGFLSGMLGVGGGSIVVPSLVLSTDMSHHAALGTSLCAMVLPAITGVMTHAKRGNVAWRVAPTLALGSAVGAYVGSKVGLQLDEDTLRGGFGILMLVLGAKTWRTAG